MNQKNVTVDLDNLLNEDMTVQERTLYFLTCLFGELNAKKIYIGFFSEKQEVLLKKERKNKEIPEEAKEIFRSFYDDGKDLTPYYVRTIKNLLERYPKDILLKVCTYLKDSRSVMSSQNWYSFSKFNTKYSSQTFNRKLSAKYAYSIASLAYDGNTFNKTDHVMTIYHYMLTGSFKWVNSQNLKDFVETLPGLTEKLIDRNPSTGDTCFSKEYLEYDEENNCFVRRLK